MITNSVVSRTITDTITETGRKLPAGAVFERVVIRYTFSVRAKAKPARGLVTGDAGFSGPHPPVRFPTSYPVCSLPARPVAKVGLPFEAPRPVSSDAKTVLPFGCGEGNERIREECSWIQNLMRSVMP